MKARLSSLTFLYALIVVLIAAILATMVIDLVAFSRIDSTRSDAHANQVKTNASLASAIAKNHTDLCAAIAAIPVGTDPTNATRLHIFEQRVGCPLTAPRPLPASGMAK